MTAPPLVSILCATHGRPHYLAEAVESFHRQTYAGPMEMVIVNDCPGQSLRCAMESVRVVNVPRAYAALMLKRRVIASLARGSLCQVWDDDDIHMPDSVAYGVEHLEPGDIASRGWWELRLESDGEVTRRVCSPLRTVTVRTQALLAAMDGLENDSPGSDYQLLQRALAARWFTNKHVGPRFPAQVIYRPYLPGIHAGTAPSAVYQQAVQEAIASGTLPSGDITIEPAWRQDYTALAVGFDRPGDIQGAG